MDFIKASLEDHDLAIEGHIAGQCVPVDRVAQPLRNLRAGILMQLLGKVGGVRRETGAPSPFSDPPHHPYGTPVGIGFASMTDDPVADDCCLHLGGVAGAAFRERCRANVSDHRADRVVVSARIEKGWRQI